MLLPGDGFTVHRVSELISLPILTIIVPTFNRSANLAILLRSLREEISFVSGDVAVIVSDNASSDDTQAVVAEASASWPELKAYRHAANTGPDKNFCFCVEMVRTRWFWIIGDDDLPKRGVIAKVVQLLREQAPALLYMRSEWVSPVCSPDQGEQLREVGCSVLDAIEFSRVVHVWVTFISGIVVDRNLLMQVLQGERIDRFSGTHLVQLGWVLPMLRTPGPFVFVDESYVLATKGNSGGYGVLTVFGVNFSKIVGEIFGANSPVGRALICGAIIHYLPGLIWGVRSAQERGGGGEDAPWLEMSRRMGSFVFYWLLLVPIGRFPIWMAQPFFQTWRVFNKIYRCCWARFSPFSGRRRV